MVIHVGGIELSDGWSVDETLEVRKLNASAGRFLKLELDIGDFEGGKNVKGITPIGFTVPDGSFHSKVRAASNNDMILSKNTKGEVYVRGNLTFEDHCHANQKFRKNICTTTHLDTAKAMSTYHVESTYYIPYEIIFRVDKSTTHLLADISFGLFSNVTRSNVKSFAAIRLELESHENERLLGFGNQPSYTNLKGTTFSINAQENGLGRGDEPITSALRVGEAVLDLLYHRKSTKTAGDSHTTYSAVPTYLSSDCRIVIVDSTNYVEFDLSSDHVTQISVYTHTSNENNNISTSLRFDTARSSENSKATSCSWADQVKTLTKYTGRQESFPAWPLDGFIAGVTGGSDKVRDVVKTLKDADIPLTSVWIQDWAGRSADGRVMFDWQVDLCYYPDWWDLVHELKSNYNVSVLSYVNPFFTTDDVTSKCEASKSRKSMYEFLESKQWLVIDQNSGHTMLQEEETGSQSTTIDLTNPDAKKWMRDVVLRCQVMGLSKFCDDTFPISPSSKSNSTTTNVIGFMADFGEHLPYQSCQVHSGKDMIEHHNEQPALWSELTSEAIVGTTLEHVGLPFHRSGNAKSPGSVRSFWAGDQEGTWGQNDGIASLPRTYISSGLSGWGNIHSDIGGMVYTPILSVRDVEILKRWFELASFLDPVLRSHPSNGQDHVPQPWSSSMIETTKKFSQIHVALKSYKQSLLSTLAKTGLPPVRHTLMCCDVESVTNEAFESLSESQLMLGTDLLIAPVLKASQKTIPSILLPPVCSNSCNDDDQHQQEESWYNIWKGHEKVYESGTTLINFDAPLGFPAVFVRSGSSVAKELSKIIMKMKSHS